jgi:hypothetical protein
MIDQRRSRSPGRCDEHRHPALESSDETKISKC